MTPTLVLVAHGSRDPRFADTTRRVRAAVADRLPGVRVELSYLDLDSPSVGEVLTDLAEPPVVVPLLLADGYHSKIDLPALIAEHHPQARQTAVIGTHSLVSGLTDRLVEAGLSGRDGILLCSVGSSDQGADLHARRRAIELSTRLNRPVEVVFATKLGTENRMVRLAIRRLRATGAQQIALSPYFLSAGLLTERVEAALDEFETGVRVAGPLGTHPAVIDAISSEYLRAARLSTIATGL
ncbi:sirohydrochlorin chelatase [Gordonia sp. ABSL1-1]|uniref:sirohydrochlorin chelatase n=1 Tax=Gordonia sp. ABSL1-1 TaxID=3053923 RepID=UPI002572A904|nr:sirohydrochlorin chelatase [Gordonia sp. ABSL1-1]MDL9935522.1 sirohydrochlorin chelatase [Gordonia sp. ABSL1-1]